VISQCDLKQENVMNKGDFIGLIADKYGCSKVEAEKVINLFTDSVTDALSKGNEVTLVGFGSFSVNKVAARNGRNPQTGATIKIAAYNQPKFKAGKTFKDAVN
jgi:DNA-binding protein HU-beta